MVSDSCPSPRMRNALRHRLAPVALAHDRRGQRVIAGLAVRPEPPHRRHHQREQRRQQRLQQVADEEVLLPRLADDGRRIDRVAPARQPIDLEHRIVVPQRVVAVVIAERPLRLADVRPARGPSARTRRWRPADAGRGRRPAAGAAPAISDASISSGTFSGSGAIAARISAGGPPRNTVTGRSTAARLGGRVVEAAALADLPCAGRCCGDRGRAAGTCRGCGPARSGGSV